MRLTKPLAKASDVAQNNPVTREVVSEGFWVRVGGKPNMSLAQKLNAYDPKVHGGEVMADGRSVGARPLQTKRVLASNPSTAQPTIT